ncbi:MAG: serine O-acetyltransferase [Deltaproteobacteria bacterium]|nr:serine O-acetyltransferase [Deltaproteobacteria bacterium]
MWSRLKEDVLVALERDPAARSVVEVLLCYPGLHALLLHRVGHSLWRRGLHLPARLLSAFSRFFTGIEIHPGASIGRRCFIDHGMGVVIGETTEIGNDVLIYQGVSFGGTSLTRGKRHPTIEDYVVVGLGSTVLGPVTVGRHSRVGAGSVVVSSVPPHSTVVGVPGRVVGESGHHSASGEPLLNLEHGELPDPLVRAISGLTDQVARLERELNELRGGAARPGEAAAGSSEPAAADTEPTAAALRLARE